MTVFELLGHSSDEIRIVRSLDHQFSLALAGHPRVVEGAVDEAKYDIRLALADVPVEHGLRFSEMPGQMDPQSLATSLATAYRNARSQSPDDHAVRGIPDCARREEVLGGAHVLYLRFDTQMEFVWVSICGSGSGYVALYHTVRFDSALFSEIEWAHLRGSFVEQHVWNASSYSIPALWPPSNITRQSARLDISAAAWAEAKDSVTAFSEVADEELAATRQMLRDVIREFVSSRTLLASSLRERIHVQVSESQSPARARVLTRGLDECHTYHDLYGWVWRADWLLGRRRQPEFRARLSYGNPYAPFGIGAFTVTVRSNGIVELVHERGGSTRHWMARSEPDLERALAEGLASARFPDPPNERVGAPGAASFKLEVPSADGTMQQAEGFPSPNYRDVSFLFSNIVAQMSGDQVLGFSLPVSTVYVSGSIEAAR